MLQLRLPFPDGVGRDTHYAAESPNTAPVQNARLGCRPLSAKALVHQRSKRSILAGDRIQLRDILHGLLKHDKTILPTYFDAMTKRKVVEIDREVRGLSFKMPGQNLRFVEAFVGEELIDDFGRSPVLTKQWNAAPRPRSHLPTRCCKRLLSRSSGSCDAASSCSIQSVLLQMSVVVNFAVVPMKKLQDQKPI